MGQLEKDIYEMQVVEIRRLLFIRTSKVEIIPEIIVDSFVRNFSVEEACNRYMEKMRCYAELSYVQHKYILLDHICEMLGVKIPKRPS